VEDAGLVVNSGGVEDGGGGGAQGGGSLGVEGGVEGGVQRLYCSYADSYGKTCTGTPLSTSTVDSHLNDCHDDCAKDDIW
jgi:hypothetical protein